MKIIPLSGDLGNQSAQKAGVTHLATLMTRGRRHHEGAEIIKE